MIGLILVLYVNTIDHSYTWDDQLVITENQATTKGLSGLKEIWTSAAYIAQRPIYRPIPQSIHAILWELAPNEPKLPHLVNIFFYILCCVLLLRVLHLYFEESPSSIKYLVVLLFALHPIHTEVVANSKSLDEILAVFFSLLALLFVKYQSKLSIPLVVLFILLACLSKISAITIPLLIISYKLFRYFKINNLLEYWRTVFLKTFNSYSLISLFLILLSIYFKIESKNNVFLSLLFLSSPFILLANNTILKKVGLFFIIYSLCSINQLEFSILLFFIYFGS
ncbi:MAG: hypothetical protein KDC82_07600, partial [Bacteroidetes bacterium]|nr:hypothetical protein [Bacteroidota bacterium]